MNIICDVNNLEEFMELLIVATRPLYWHSMFSLELVDLLVSSHDTQSILNLRLNVSPSALIAEKSVVSCALQIQVGTLAGRLCSQLILSSNCSYSDKKGI